MNSGEVGELDYIDYSYWNELSDGTRKVKQAVKNVTKSRIVFNVPNDNFLSAAEAVERGTLFPPIIVVADSANKQGEILEGHMRATGYALARQPEHPLMAIWGTLRE